MNQEYNAYAEKLVKYMKSNIIMLIVFLCIFIIFSIVLFSLFKEKKIFIYLMPCAAVLCLFVYVTSIFPYQYDIKNNSYVEYTGEFFVEQSNYSNRGPDRILIRTGDEIKSVRYIYAIDDVDVKDNTYYSGKIVWSKKSKVLVDFEATESKDS